MLFNTFEGEEVFYKSRCVSNSAKVNLLFFCICSLHRKILSASFVSNLSRPEYHCYTVSGVSWWKDKGNTCSSQIQLISWHYEKHRKTCSVLKPFTFFLYDYLSNSQVLVLEKVYHFTILVKWRVKLMLSSGTMMRLRPDEARTFVGYLQINLLVTHTWIIIVRCTSSFKSQH